ncbi:MAG: hypothetical protein AAF491_09290 [Verrucomicrobiota bacterium]
MKRTSKSTAPPLLAGLFLSVFLAPALASSQEAGSQEEAAGLAFVTVCNGTGLEGELEVRINGKNPIDGKGYTSGGDTGQIGFPPGTVTVEVFHEACLEPAKTTLTLENEANAFVVAFAKEEVDLDSGESAFQLGLGKLPHRPTPGKTTVTVFACDPNGKIGSVMMNGSELALPSLQPVPFPADYDDVLTVKGTDGGELEPFLLSREEHHYCLIFPVIGGENEDEMQGTWLLDEKIVYDQEAELALLREARQREEEKKKAMAKWLESQRLAREEYTRFRERQQ